MTWPVRHSTTFDSSYNVSFPEAHMTDVAKNPLRVDVWKALSTQAIVAVKTLQNYCDAVRKLSGSWGYDK